MKVANKVELNFNDQQSMAENAMSRSNIYALLAAVYYNEPSKELIKKIKETEFFDLLSDLGIHLDGSFFYLPEEKLHDDLAVEFARLFLGPGKHISPHESVHLYEDDGGGMLWGERTARVKKFIEGTGLEFKYQFNEVPDHISAELEFMHIVTKQVAQSWKKNNIDEMIYCLKIENKFLEEHLAKWVPQFCDKVAKEAELSFYQEMAKLTKSFIIFAREDIENIEMLQ